MLEEIGRTVYIADKHTYDTYYSNTNNWQPGKRYIYDPDYSEYYRAVAASQTVQYTGQTSSNYGAATTTFSSAYAAADMGTTSVKFSVLGVATAVPSAISRFFDPELTIQQQAAFAVWDLGIAAVGFLLGAATCGIGGAVAGLFYWGITTWATNELTKMAHSSYYEEEDIP